MARQNGISVFERRKAQGNAPKNQLEGEQTTDRIELSGLDFHATGGHTGGEIDLVDGRIAGFRHDGNIGHAVFGKGTVAQRHDIGRQAGDGDEFTALGTENAELVGQILVRELTISLIVEIEEEVVAADGEGALEGTTAGERFEVEVVVLVEVGFTFLHAYHTRGERSLLALVGHGLGEAGREDIEIAVGVVPDHLEVLRLETPAGVADFVGLDELTSLECVVVKDGDPAFVGILRPLQFAFLVSTALAAAVLLLDEIGIAVANVFTAVYGRTVLAQSHGDGGGVEFALALEQTGEGDVLTVAEEVFREELRLLGVVVAFGLGGDVQIRNEEGLGQIAVGIGGFLVAVACRHGHQFVVPRAVGGEAAHFETFVALFEPAVAQNIRTGGAGVGLVVLKRAEVLVLEENVLETAVEEEAVVARAEGAA